MAMRFHSAAYGAAGSWACRATTRRTASAAGDPSVPGDDEIDWAGYVATVESAAIGAAGTNR